MSDFICKVYKAVKTFNMLQNGDNVIVALSGGADSISLLYSLIELRSEYNLTLYAAHINHNLRGEESERDESFVRAICEKNGIELFVKSVDVRKLAQDRGQSEELCGRDVRYEFFYELCARYNAKTATAHTASDNAETVIFNLARGAGVNGLSGITPVRESIIRPLIYTTRGDVEAYCAENKLEYVTDSTNLQDVYTRNKIRHSVIPVLKELNPDLENTVSRESDMLRTVNSFIELKTDEAIKESKTENGYNTEYISSLHEALRLSLIRKLCLKNNADADYKLIKLIDDNLKGGAVDLHNGVRAVIKQGTLRFVKDKDTDEFSVLELKPDTKFIYNRKEYSVKEIKTDYNGLVFRTRKAGDVFTLPKRNVTKTLKKLFNELKIPEEKRDSVMLVAKGSEILWIEGVGVSKEAPGKLRINVKNII